MVWWCELPSSSSQMIRNTFSKKWLEGLTAYFGGVCISLPILMDSSKPPPRHSIMMILWNNLTHMSRLWSQLNVLPTRVFFLLSHQSLFISSEDLFLSLEEFALLSVALNFKRKEFLYHFTLWGREKNPLNWTESRKYAYVICHFNSEVLLLYSFIFVMWCHADYRVRFPSSTLFR